MRAKQIVELAQKAAEDKKALDPVILHVGKHSSIATYFLIVHGTSDRHVQTIANHVVDELENQGEHVWHLEGVREGRWAVVDYGSVVIHVFHHEARKFYNLERLWGDRAEVKWKIKKKKSKR